MSWIWAALMPHPPILVPAVGQGREKEASKTLDGIEKMLAKIKSLPDNGCPEVLVILSPHQPHVPNSLYLNTAMELQGSLAPFGAPDATFKLKRSVAADEFERVLRISGLPFASQAITDLTKDHASLVPLYFLSQIWPQMPEIIIANPVGLPPELAFKLGQFLAEIDLGKAALLASGDLSHRLKPEAPGGYSPEGALFDQDLVEAISNARPAELVGSWPAKRLEQVGECGLRSALTLMGLVQGPVEVLSYEGPFGVGYATALHLGAPISTEAAKKSSISHTVIDGSSHPYPHLARLTLEKYLAGEEPKQELPYKACPDGVYWADKGGVFVSLKNKDGSLRGCIGTIVPTTEHVGMEIMQNAISAATKDQRFSPVTLEELAELTISVDILSPPERVASLAKLDPSKWGIIVEKNGQRGLLLPDLDGVDTVETQVRIAAQKAGLTDLTNLSIWRFGVERYFEKRDLSIV